MRDRRFVFLHRVTDEVPVLVNLDRIMACWRVREATVVDLGAVSYGQPDQLRVTETPEEIVGMLGDEE